MQEKNKLAQIKWQCRRGMLELDLVLLNFLDKGYVDLSKEERQNFSYLLQHEDPVLWDWLILGHAVNEKELKLLVDKIRDKNS